MTSKDEENEEVTYENTSTSTGSADTDSTLVDGTADATTSTEVPTAARATTTEIAPYTSPTSPTVLGKRPGESLESDREGRRSPMDIDTPASPNRTAESSSSQPMLDASLVDADVEMTDGRRLDDSKTPLQPMGPPPLPPRKRPDVGVGEMMFGKLATSLLIDRLLN